MNQSNKLGIKDFIKMIYDGHPEYTLIAVKAPFEATISGFIHICNSLKTRKRFETNSVKLVENKVKNVKVFRGENMEQITAKTGDIVAPVITFLEVDNCQWTVILRSIFYARDEIFDVSPETKALSTELQTQAIMLLEEDTSASIAYELVENGNRLEYFEEWGDDDFNFESQLREKPNIEFDDEDDENFNDDYDCTSDPRIIFVDDFFRQLGIYLPACYTTDKDGDIFLAISDSSQGKIQRADYFKLEFDF